MTRDEIMAMGEQALCDWLYQKEVLFRVGADEQEMLKFRGKWNLPACAFAARNYLKTQGLGGSWWRGVMKIIGPHKFQLEDSTPLDWLRAAAIVITEQGAGK
jgi:hypothetical protein